MKRWGATVFIIGIAAAVAVVGAACGSSPKGSSAGGSGSTGTDGVGGKAPTYGSGGCDTCVDMTCQAQLTSCQGDPSCQAYLDCLDACPITATGDADATCVAQCPTGDSAASKQTIFTFVECKQHNAMKACSQCGAPQMMYYNQWLNQSCPSPPAETMPCPICEVSECCITAQMEQGTPDVKALSDCLKACPDTGFAPCQLDCVNQHAAGSDDYGLLLGCMSVLCVDKCSDAPPQPLDVCIRDVCGDEYMALLEAHGGYAMQACIQNCPIDDTVCDSACYTMYPEAFDLYYPFAECVQVGCGIN